jgi:hypothetical protein
MAARPRRSHKVTKPVKQTKHSIGMARGEKHCRDAERSVRLGIELPAGSLEVAVLQPLPLLLKSACAAGSANSTHNRSREGAAGAIVTTPRQRDSRSSSHLR